MAIGALQTGYTTLYGKIAGLGTQNGQTRGSNFREHIDGTEKKAPYQHLAQNGTITYKGVTFVCDTDRNRITLGDVTDRSKCLNISLKGGGCLMVNRDNLSDLSQAITMFCPEDINRIMTAIAEDKRAQRRISGRSRCFWKRTKWKAVLGKSSRNKRMYYDLTKGKISKNLILFALPMMAGNLMQQFYNIADTLIVGRVVGKNALAAVGSAYTLMTFLTSIFLGLSMGAGVLFSIYKGKNDKHARG